MIHVRIRSHDKNNAILARLSRRRLLPAAKKAAAEALAILADEMRARAPVDTGALRDSIEVEPPTGNFPGGRVIVGGNGAAGSTFYGVFVEFGTVYQPAQPFMRPAAAAAGERMRRAVVYRLAPAIKG